MWTAEKTVEEAETSRETKKKTGRENALWSVGLYSSS